MTCENQGIIEICTVRKLPHIDNFITTKKRDCDRGDSGIQMVSYGTNSHNAPTHARTRKHAHKRKPAHTNLTMQTRYTAPSN